MKIALEKIVKSLGINLSDTSTIAFMGEELMVFEKSINEFVEYVGKYRNAEQFKYARTGYEKFTKLVDSFKAQQLAFNDKENIVMYLYKEKIQNKIQNKIEIIFTQIVEMLNKNGISFFSKEAIRYLESDEITKDLGFLKIEKSDRLPEIPSEKGINIVDKIGRSEICRLIANNTFLLSEAIDKAIKDTAKYKKSLSLGYIPKHKQIDSNKNNLVIQLMNKKRVSV